jgi:murein DD-endopeptidase MepM/ murein hydrolase activator NlpD
MLPLLLGAGRMLLAGGTRAAAGGGIRGAIANTFKDKAMDAAKEKAIATVKGGERGKLKRKSITTSKLLSKTKTSAKKIGKGGALILRNASAIVKKGKGSLAKSIKGQSSESQGSASVKGDTRGEILKELEKIKIDFIKVKEISTQKLLNTKEDSRVRYLEQSKKKSDEQEADLEKKKEKKKTKKLGVKGPKLSFFDMISNFLTNVLIGSLLNFALHYAPQIIKMFGEIGKGLTNTWNALRLGIITLTTVFPKQVKFIAKLTAKIVGPPARLIGRLLLKAGNLAGNLFKKAGGVIFNLIKGPLSSLVKRVGGEALEKGVKGAAKGAARLAGKAAGAAGNALGSTARILKRFKSFSKIFKRVPVVGALIGIGIDLALGEKLDRAVVGAIGATLGAGIGAAIGQGLIPIPLVGAAVGGFVGSGIGDWAAKSIYGNLTGRVADADKENPIERRAFGGSVNVRSSSTPSRTFSKSTSVQRKTSSSSTLSDTTLQKAKETVLKDENSARRFSNLSSAYGAIPFVGEAMKLGLDVSLGEKVSKTRTDAVAESIGSSIGIALKNEEFSVPGFNRRIVGEFSKNLTTWAKRKVFNEVKSRENQFAMIQQKAKDEAEKGGTKGGGDDGGSADPLSAADFDKIKASSADKKAAAHLSTLEASSPQHVADVYQVILNRAAKQSGGIPAVITAREQFSPYSAAIFGTSADGAAARKYGPLKVTKKELFELAGKPDGIEQLTRRFGAGNPRIAGQVLADFETGGPLSKNAKKFVGGAQYFMGYATNVSGERRRPDGGNYIRDNYGGGYGFNHHRLPIMAMGGGHVVTSAMGMRNFALSPGMHMGVDIAGTTGEPLQAFTDGTVEATSPPSPSAGYGNWVNWIDNNGIGHFYGHLNKAPFVKAGQKVKKGTILGELGSTGNSSGPHLHWEAATNPRDTGMPKSNVLSRFNPLSRYNKESPFGGSTRPDSSMASSSGSSPSPGSSSSSSPEPKKELSSFVKNFAVIGDPRGGRGGGDGSGAITWKEWGKYLRGLGFIPNENAFDPGKYDNSQHATPDHGHNAMDAGWWKDNNYVTNTKKWEKIFASLEGDAFSQVIGPIKDPGGHGNGTNTHLHFTAKKLDSKGQIPLTPKLKALMGNPNPTSTLDDSDVRGSGGGGVPEQKKELSEFVKNFAVIGDPVKGSVSSQIQQTPSYANQSSTVILTQLPATSQQLPQRTSAGSRSKYSASSPMVNSYAMVSRQLISSSMYKI